MGVGPSPSITAITSLASTSPNSLLLRLRLNSRSALAGNAAEFEFTITHADSGVLHRLVRIVPELTPDGTVPQSTG